MNTIRVFIAIEIPDAILAQLDRLIMRLHNQDKSHVLRWTQARNIHITLRFLGETPLSKLEPLSQILVDQASRQAPFDIRIGGLGAFPSPARPRVLWLGMQVPPDLVNLQKEIEQSVLSIGFSPEERPFTPHLTLARLAQSATQDETIQVGALIAAWIKTPPEINDSFNVNQVHIFRSDLRPSGAVYTRIVTAPLVAANQDKPLSY